MDQEPLIPGSNWISNIGFALLLLSYLVTNIFALRFLLMVGSVALAIWGALALPSPTSTIAWNVTFAVINLFQLCLLFINMRPVRLKPQEQELLEKLFSKRYPLSRKEYKKLVKLAEWVVFPREAKLTTEGDGSVFFGVVFRGQLQVSRSDVAVGKIKPFEFYGEVEILERLQTYQVTTCVGVEPVDPDQVEFLKLMAPGRLCGLKKPKGVRVIMHCEPYEAGAIVVRWRIAEVLALVRKKGNQNIGHALNTLMGFNLAVKLHRMDSEISSYNEFKKTFKHTMKRKSLTGSSARKADGPLAEEEMLEMTHAHMEEVVVEKSTLDPSHTKASHPEARKQN